MIVRSLESSMPRKEGPEEEGLSLQLHCKHRKRGVKRAGEMGYKWRGKGSTLLLKGGSNPGGKGG